MRYMYTTKPDEGCHEVESGIYGRPVHTSDEPKLKAKGWSLSIDALRGTSDGLRKDEKEGRQEEAEVDRDMWAAAYERKFGRKPHHKMKVENIRAKVEADDQG